MNGATTRQEKISRVFFNNYTYIIDLLFLNTLSKKILD